MRSPECVRIGTSNVFSNWGIAASVFTSAFEFKGHGKSGALSYIQNNTIDGQPAEGIDLASSQHVSVSGNTIRNAGRNITVSAFGYPGLQIRDVGGWRPAGYIDVLNNTIQNTRPDRFTAYGIKVGGCQIFNGSSLCDNIANVTLTSNSISAMKIGDACKLQPPSFVNSPSVDALDPCVP